MTIFPTNAKPSTRRWWWARATTSANADFERVLIGLSGGIDSSLTAAIAVDAVGRENVTGVGMPGPYSSEHSVTDARDLAGNLGIRFELISIREQYEAFLEALEPVFDGASMGVTEENLQSRLRGVTLMALSNKWGALVLTTGNKSELAVGYCTLYGDMCGGLAVISDVPKTLVYSLSRVANQRHRQRDSGKRFQQAAVGRAAAGSERHRFTAGVRRAGSDPARLISRTTSRRNGSPIRIHLPRNAGARYRQQSGPQRIQAAAGRARSESNHQGVRHRTPLPHRTKIFRMKYNLHASSFAGWDRDRDCRAYLALAAGAARAGRPACPTADFC